LYFLGYSEWEKQWNDKLC